MAVQAIVDETERPNYLGDISSLFVGQLCCGFDLEISKINLIFYKITAAEKI
jgi:hypothetical protein